MGSKYDREWIEVSSHHAGIFECLLLSGYSPSEDVTHRHSTAPRSNSCQYPGIMRDISCKVKHHLQHESATLPEPALCFHGFEPLRWESVTRVSHILINNHSRTVPIVHQEVSGRRDSNTECQREFFGVPNVTFDESLINNKIVNALHLIKYPPLCV
jgi:hypothetical protein